LSIREPGCAGQPDSTRFNVVVDRTGPSAGDLVFFFQPLLEHGRRSLDAREHDVVVAKQYAGLAGFELAARHDDLHVTFQPPLGIVEIEPRRAGLLRQHLQVALRDLHALEQQ
jgi:hypothetical protein